MKQAAKKAEKNLLYKSNSFAEATQSKIKENIKPNKKLESKDLNEMRKFHNSIKKKLFNAVYV